MNRLTIVIIILLILVLVSTALFVTYYVMNQESFVDIGLNTVNYKQSEFPLKLFCAARYDKPTFELTSGGEFKYI
jgi:flagellar basal body-associated protein FliL